MEVKKKQLCKSCNTIKGIADFYESKLYKCKLCIKQCNHHWKQNNPNYMKSWRVKNPNYLKTWRKNNPEKVIEYNTNWYNNNRERINEYQNIVITAW